MSDDLPLLMVPGLACNGAGRYAIVLAGFFLLVACGGKPWIEAIDTSPASCETSGLRAVVSQKLVHFTPALGRAGIVRQLAVLARSINQLDERAQLTGCAYSVEGQYPVDGTGNQVATPFSINVKLLSSSTCVNYEDPVFTGEDVAALSEYDWEWIAREDGDFGASKRFKEMCFALGTGVPPE